MKKKKFNISDIVYFVTDEEQIGFIVTGIIERKTHYDYLVSYGSNHEVEVSEVEISKDKDLVIKFSGN